MASAHHAATFKANSPTIRWSCQHNGASVGCAREVEVRTPLLVERMKRSLQERQQHQPGTVYGGPSGHLTVALPSGNPAVENSGSLTGHILAQGWSDSPTTPASTAKVVVVLLVGLGILVAVGLLVVLVAGDAFSSLFDGLLNS